jgi:hypothetical protein
MIGKERKYGNFVFAILKFKELLVLQHNFVLPSFKPIV